MVESDLVDQFGGFDIVLIEQGGVEGLFVQPKAFGGPDGGCSSCSGCH